MGDFLSRDAVLNAQDLETVDVYVPEWGGKVRVRTLTAEEKDRLEISLVMANGKIGDPKNIRNVRARFVAEASVDEDGKKLFRESDVIALGQKSAAALSRVFNAIQELNIISDQDIEEMAKNFGRGQSSTSVSGSAATSESGTSMP